MTEVEFGGGANPSIPKLGADIGPWLIDATLKNIEGLGRVEGALDGVKLRVDSLDSKVDRLETKVDRLENKVDQLEGKFDRLEGKVDRLETKMDAKFDRMQTILDAIAAELKGHGNWIHTLKVALSGIAFIAGIVVTGVVLSWLKSRFGF